MLCYVLPVDGMRKHSASFSFQFQSWKWFGNFMQRPNKTITISLTDQNWLITTADCHFFFSPQYGNKIDQPVSLSQTLTWLTDNLLLDSEDEFFSGCQNVNHLHRQPRVSMRVGITRNLLSVSGYPREGFCFPFLAWPNVLEQCCQVKFVDTK